MIVSMLFYFKKGGSYENIGHCSRNAIDSNGFTTG